MNERRNGSCQCSERTQYAHYAPYGPRTMPHSHKDARTAAAKKSDTPYRCAEKVEHAHSCGCAEKTACEGTAFTPVMAYVPHQEWEKPFCEMEALCVGTLFPSLEKPFVGKRGCCND